MVDGTLEVVGEGVGVGVGVGVVVGPSLELVVVVGVGEGVVDGWLLLGFECGWDDSVVTGVEASGVLVGAG